MSYALIDWNDLEGQFTVRHSAGGIRFDVSANDAVARASEFDQNLRVNERMPAERLIEVMAAAIFAQKPLQNVAGKELTGTPVQAAKVHHITRQHIGNVLPDGWYVEVQLNRYSACWGEQLALPSRKSLAAAISDIQEFLALSVKQANDDLLDSIRAQRVLAEEEQLSMWSSSDSAARAVDASTELDDIAP